MNLTLAEDEVTALCVKSGVSISATEPLPAGGCHLVTTTIEGAEKIRRKLSKHLITGRVKLLAYSRA